jgi:hypothetical protein
VTPSGNASDELGKAYLRRQQARDRQHFLVLLFVLACAFLVAGWLYMYDPARLMP